jgi:hypothetical protein
MTPTPIAQATTTSPTTTTLPTKLTRAETEAIGPSTDTPASNPDNTNGPVLVIMLLLTTGARHPYKIDERYLKKRNVTVDDMDPYNIGVYTLKELIWRDWREGTWIYLLPVNGCRNAWRGVTSCFWPCCNLSTSGKLDMVGSLSPYPVRLACLP